MNVLRVRDRRDAEASVILFIACTHVNALSVCGVPDIATELFQFRNNERNNGNQNTCNLPFVNAELFQREHCDSRYVVHTELRNVKGHQTF